MRNRTYNYKVESALKGHDIIVRYEEGIYDDVFVSPKYNPTDMEEPIISSVLGYNKSDVEKEQWILFGEQMLAAIFLLGSVHKLDHT